MRTTNLGPFGEVIRATGPMAEANPFRFSTKYQDDETDLVYHGYRYHNASTGRWLSRDPLQEEGGLNLYVLADNDPISFVDLLGLTKVKKDAKSITQAQAMSGIWGWTDMESQAEREAKLKNKGCLCVVKRKPEMIFTILVQTARSGKQAWKENAEFDGTIYLNVNVYISSGVASIVQKHEERRYQAWKTVLTSYWTSHYETPAASLTAPTCDELKQKIADLLNKAKADWPNSPDGRPQLIRLQEEIGKESINVKPVVEKSAWSGVYVEYELAQ